MVLQSGQLLDSYRIVGPLGGERSGGVYEAEHAIAGRRFAIKLVPDVQSDSPWVVRGLEEFRAVSALAHPNIVSVLDFGFHDDALYVVTELLVGTSLSEQLAEHRPWPVAHALEVLRQIGAALDAVHAIGVQHGALTAEDVFLVPDPQAPGGERVKVANFGLATVRNKDAAAPSGPVDPRADSSALALIAQKMLSRQPSPPALAPGVLRALEPEACYGTAAEFVAVLSAAATGQSSPRAGVPHKPLYLDENVQFSLYRPRHVVPARWYPMLVFAHLSEGHVGDEEQDPQGEVTAQARQVLGDLIGSFDDLQVDSSHAVPREGQITFVPVVPGVQFNPPSRTFLWEESVQREEFRLRADAALDGKTVRGSLTVFLGTIILADIPLVIAVDSAPHANARPDEVAGAHARPYRLIFASYSHKDAAIVEEFERHVEASALGDHYLRDCRDLRVGEVWQDGLVRLIERADIFQLFWSSNSLRSTFVRQEWEHALGLGRPSFVRPVYWEEPLPRSADGTLPPQALRDLHFQLVAFARGVTPPPLGPAFGIQSPGGAAPAPQLQPVALTAEAPVVASDEAEAPTPLPSCDTPKPIKPARATLAPKPSRRWPVVAPLLAAAGFVLFLFLRGPVVGPTSPEQHHTGSSSKTPELPTFTPRPGPEMALPAPSPDAGARHETASGKTTRGKKPWARRVRPAGQPRARDGERSWSSH